MDGNRPGNVARNVFRPALSRSATLRRTRLRYEVIVSLSQLEQVRLSLASGYVISRSRDYRPSEPHTAPNLARMRECYALENPVNEQEW
jgi:hypothetical protein